MRLTLAGIIATTVISAARAEDNPGDQWHREYTALGFIIRAVAACPTDKRAVLKKFPKPPAEVQAFAKAFPKTVEGWMTEGAEAFNGDVMRHGLNETCSVVR